MSRSHGEGHFVFAVVVKGVTGVLAAGGFAVAKVPFVVRDFLSRWIGGRGASELHGLAFANCGEGEVGGRHGIHFDKFGFCAARFAAHSDGAGVNAGHIHGAVRDGRILLGGAEPVRSRPAKGGSRLVLCGQVDGLTHAVRTAAVHQWRQDAAVGGAGAHVFK